jgi:hypothetical protein
MAGFDNEDYDEVLNLAEHSCASVVLCALAFRAADDKYGKMQKVRFDIDELFVRNI